MFIQKSKLRLVTLLLFALAIGNSNATSHITRIGQVKSIYIDKMGTTVESERFRFFLKNHLQKRGFRISNKPESAHAIMKGFFVIRLDGRGTTVRATMFIYNTAGDQLWSKDFAPKFRFNNRKFGGDQVQFRAFDVAKALRKVWKKDNKQPE